MIQARTRSRLPLPQPADVHTRRSYAEGRFGQIHMWTAYPSGGGFDERTPVVCLHHAGGSGRLYAPVLREIGNDRSIYAPDLPGHGTSEAPPARFTVADLAAAIGDFLDGLRLRAIDVIGHQLGALIAAELAIARPQQVRRVMLWSVPAWSTQERAALAQASAGSGALGTRENGSDVVEEWQRALAARGPGVTTGALAAELADRLHAGVNAAKAQAAALEYSLGERLPLLRQPTLIVRARDEFWDHAPRARASLPNATLLDLPEFGQGFIGAAPQKFASIAREFLDR